MPTRYLKESICTSENLIALSAEAERFFYRLIVNVDDFGRIDARPQVLRAKCFTMMEERVSFADIEVWLEELRSALLIARYFGNGKPYLEIITFTEHNRPRAEKSRCPNPPTVPGAGTPTPEGVDTCGQLQADASKCLPIPSYSKSYSNAKAESESGTADLPPPRPLTQSASVGRALAAALKQLDGRLGPKLRLALYEVFVDITGTRALTELRNDDPANAGTVAHMAAHTTVCDLWDIGYKTENELLALEGQWYAVDWRGQRGDKPTCSQLLKFASDQKTGDRRNSHAAPADSAARTVVAVPAIEDAFAVLR